MRAVLGNFVTKENVSFIASNFYIEKSILASPQYILASSEDQIRNTLKELYSIEGKEKFKKISEFFFKSPITEKQDKPPIDLFIDGMTAQDLDSFYRSQVIEMVLSKRDIEIRTGVTRDEVYTNLIQPYAATAQAVVALDPYFLENYFEKKHDGFEWIIKRFFEDGITSVTIYTKRLTPEKFGNVDNNTLKAKLKSTLKTLNISEEFSLRIFAGRSPHKDRHFRFIYGSQRYTPTVALGKGFGVFENSTLKSAYTVVEEKADAAIAREFEISRQQDKDQIKVP